MVVHFARTRTTEDGTEESGACTLDRERGIPVSLPSIAEKERSVRGVARLKLFYMTPQSQTSQPMGVSIR